MIEALVSLRLQGEKGQKRRGDILAVKPAGSPWGTEERRLFLVVQWEAPSLEDRLRAQRAAGEPWPVIVEPYAEYEDRPVPGKDETMRVRTIRSRQYVDVDRLDRDLKAEVFDANRAVATIPTAQYRRKTSTEAIDDRIR